MKQYARIALLIIYIVSLSGCIPSDFDNAIEFVLIQEGKFSNNKSDPGGATNYGISLRLLRSLGVDIDMDGDTDIDDIIHMTKNDAKKIYKKEWWDKYHYQQIDDKQFQRMILSLSVNMGAKNAHKIIQKSLNEIPKPKDRILLVVNGNLSPACIHQLNDITRPEIKALFKIKVQKNAIDMYESFVKRNEHLRIFLKGWENRVFEITR